MLQYYFCIYSIITLLFSPMAYANELHIFLDISNSMNAKHETEDKSVFELSVSNIKALIEDYLNSSPRPQITCHIFNALIEEEIVVDSIHDIDSIVKKKPTKKTNLLGIIQKLQSIVEDSKNKNDLYYIFSDLKETINEPDIIKRSFKKLHSSLKDNQAILHCYDVSNSGDDWIRYLDENIVKTYPLTNKKLCVHINDFTPLLFYYDQDICYSSTVNISGYFPEENIANHKFKVSAKLERFPDSKITIDHADLTDFMDDKGGHFNGELGITIDKNILKKIKNIPDLDKKKYHMNFSFVAKSRNAQKPSLNIQPEKKTVDVTFTVLPDFRITGDQNKEITIISLTDVKYNQIQTIPFQIKWNHAAHNKTLKIVIVNEDSEQTGRNEKSQTGRNENAQIRIRFKNDTKALLLNDQQRFAENAFRVHIKEEFFETMAFQVLFKSSRQIPKEIKQPFIIQLNWLENIQKIFYTISENKLILPCNFEVNKKNFVSLIPNDLLRTSKCTISYVIEPPDDLYLQLYHSNSPKIKYNPDKEYKSNYFSIPIFNEQVNIGIKLCSTISKSYKVTWEIRSNNQIMVINNDHKSLSQEIKFKQSELKYILNNSNKGKENELAEIVLKTKGENISTSGLKLNYKIDPFIDLIKESISFSIENMTGKQQSNKNFIEEVLFEESRNKSIAAEQLNKNCNIYFGIKIDSLNWRDRYIKTITQTGKIKVIPDNDNIQPAVIKYSITKIPSISPSIIILGFSIVMLIIFGFTYFVLKRKEKHDWYEVSNEATFS